MAKVNPKRVESALSLPKDDDSMADDERPRSIMSNEKRDQKSRKSLASQGQLSASGQSSADINQETP